MGGGPGRLNDGERHVLNFRPFLSPTGHRSERHIHYSGWPSLVWNFGSVDTGCMKRRQESSSESSTHTRMTCHEVGHAFSSSLLLFSLLARPFVTMALLVHTRSHTQTSRSTGTDEPVPLSTSLSTLTRHRDEHLAIGRCCRSSKFHDQSVSVATNHIHVTGHMAM